LRPAGNPERLDARDGFEPIHPERNEMYSIRDHMASVRKVEEALPLGNSLWLISLTDEMRGWFGGRIVNVTRANAASLIEDGAYRLATDEEALAHEAGEEKKREAARFARINTARHYTGSCIVLEPKTDQEPTRPQPKKQDRGN
jgi:hypothetical protein